MQFDFKGQRSVFHVWVLRLTENGFFFNVGFGQVLGFLLTFVAHQVEAPDDSPLGALNGNGLFDYVGYRVGYIIRGIDSLCFSGFYGGVFGQNRFY